MLIKGLIRLLIPQKIASQLFDGNERSTLVTKNIFLSFIYKGINILTQLALVPLTLNYLDKSQYGIWLTLAAIIGWFSFFDIGLGNGLRNKVAEAVASENFLLARIYISTSYAVVTVIFLTVLLLVWILNPLLRWDLYLNAPSAMSDELSQLALITFSFFCLRFIFGLISNVLFALQEAAINNLITTASNLLTILAIYILTLFIPSSLLWVGIIYSSVPVIILFIVSVLLFLNKYRHVCPSLFLVKLQYTKDLLGLGYKFFVIQVAAIILFSSTNVILTQLFGPSSVTTYNIAFRYFSLLTMVGSIIATPLWSAFTDAYVKRDNEWIKLTMQKLNKITVGFIVIAIMMAAVSDKVYKIWIDETVHVPLSVSVIICIYVIFSMISLPYNTFVNGVGKVKLQYYTAIVTIIITVPLAIFFGKYLDWGVPGVVGATLFTTVPCALLWRIQFNKITAGEARGIWNK